MSRTVAALGVLAGIDAAASSAVPSRSTSSPSMSLPPLRAGSTTSHALVEAYQTSTAEIDADAFSSLRAGDRLEVGPAAVNRRRAESVLPSEQCATLGFCVRRWRAGASRGAFRPFELAKKRQCAR